MNKLTAGHGLAVKTGEKKSDGAEAGHLVSRQVDVSNTQMIASRQEWLKSYGNTDELAGKRSELRFMWSKQVAEDSKRHDEVWAITITTPRERV